MRTVEGPRGTHYVLLKESDEASLVRDPESGERRHLPNEDLAPVDGESPLETEARAVPEPVRRVLTAVHDDRALGLLVAIDDRTPVAVEDMLGGSDLCESDLHGLLAEFRAADLVVETDVDGRREYETTSAASEALSILRGDGKPATDAGNDGPR